MALRRPSDIRKDGPRRRRHGSGADTAEHTPKTWPSSFARSPRDREALLVLLGLASVTARRLLDLASRVGSASDCLEAIRNGEGASVNDVEKARSLRSDDIARHLEMIGGRFIAVHDAEYPPQLLDLFDPPAGLFVLGRRMDEPHTTVAIVGARRCSPGGREMATMIGRTLAETGVCVVSGGAKGIDAAAHRGALSAGGPTVCVLGSGLDVPYPEEHQRLLAEIAKHGSVVTEYTPGTPAEPFRFPARNRLVAALARAVVVVEGAAGSGSTITTDHAVDLGREVFAVPGSPASAVSAVPLGLIREGATLIRGPEDLLEDLGIASSAGHADADEAPLALAGVSDAEHRVWDALTTSLAPDVLAAETSLPVPAVISALTALELKSLVRQTGGRYERRQRMRP
jgi:DNA processing protein